MLMFSRCRNLVGAMRVLQGNEFHAFVSNAKRSRNGRSVLWHCLFLTFLLSLEVVHGFELHHECFADFEEEVGPMNAEKKTRAEFTAWIASDGCLQVEY